MKRLAVIAFFLISVTPLSAGRITPLNISKGGGVQDSDSPTWTGDHVFQGTVETQSGVTNAFSTVSSTTTLDGTHHIVAADASSTAFTINLPSSSGQAGRRLLFKKVDSSTNTVTIDPSGAETVDGFSTIILTTENEATEIVSDGSGWLLY